MKIFLSKSLFKIGDLNYNLNKIKSIYDKALEDDCDLLIFSEMSITGFPIYNQIEDKDFLAENDKVLEELIKHTKNKKTRILLGCPYYVEKYTTEDGIIKESQLYNSAILINDNYINAIHNKTSISKNNLFNEYKYFDKEPILKEISYENDNFDLLISDEISNNKNILFIKDRDTDFIVCLDTEIKENIEKKKKQLSKIAKWTKKPIIYSNNLTYDIENKYKTMGEVFIINDVGDIVYTNIDANECLVRFTTKINNGKLEIKNIDKEKKSNNDFLSILANNYKDKNIIVEIDENNKNIVNEGSNNIIYITFKEELNSNNIKYINKDEYIKNLKLNKELKSIILKNIYKDSIIY